MGGLGRREAREIRRGAWVDGFIVGVLTGMFIAALAVLFLVGF